ncbi:enoyl-CoA hydratase/isomerase family protein [Bradyrhizobium genosp. SA-3]|uniref:Enoyl-CoA hydratase/isomerase family protein n=2 Tax=Nitrobacteraceae TaxID=41294 RepID=A0A4Q0QAU6_9BRAD|nr:enoyl-CoA hydratase/isomerase family protein [Bradyrhizobium zhanjiangense]RXG85792.1 enoyl-CoA hydratase/isomerase family protein [Bradyrhizobium zhanjiangense]RZN09497.1 enoyl-CoA hydratase/isomerase family protein [Bradyrhizobium genosp. SA-3]
MIQDDALLIDRHLDLVTMTMNRPPANALNNELVERLLDAFRALASQAMPPGIVLTGQGTRFFSAGGDIKEVTGIEISRPRMRSFHALLCEMERYPAPLVCAVRGYAVGGALEFLLHADYVIANGECKIGFPEINHGLLPAAKGMRKAVQKLGLRDARALLYCGELVDARKALEIGAIDEIAATSDVTSRALEECKYLRGKDQRLFAAIKRSLNLTDQMDDASLEAMTIEDLGAYLTGDSSADARARFLSKNAK